MPRDAGAQVHTSASSRKELHPRIAGGAYCNYAAVLFTDAGYLILAGTFDPDRHDDQIDAFRSMARSLRLSG